MISLSYTGPFYEEKSAPSGALLDFAAAKSQFPGLPA
jgi:hypothetical protein